MIARRLCVVLSICLLAPPAHASLGSSLSKAVTSLKARSAAKRSFRDYVRRADLGAYRRQALIKELPNTILSVPIGLSVGLAVGTFAGARSLREAAGYAATTFALTFTDFYRAAARDANDATLAHGLALHRAGSSTPAPSASQIAEWKKHGVLTSIFKP